MGEWFIARAPARPAGSCVASCWRFRLTRPRGAPVIIAAVVNKNDKTMVLRNDAGVPNWAGQKAHAPQ